MPRVLDCLQCSWYLVLVSTVLDCLQCSLVLVSRVLDCLQYSWYLVLGPLVLVVLVVRGGSDTMDKWPLLPSQARRLKQKLHKFWLWSKKWCINVLFGVINDHIKRPCLMPVSFNQLLIQIRHCPVWPLSSSQSSQFWWWKNIGQKTKIFEFTILLFSLLC